MGIWIVSSTAAPLLVGHTLVTKVMMTVLFRAKTTAAATSEEEASKIFDSQRYKRISSTQLNEAEYSALLVACTCYLAVKGVAAPVASTLAVFGQVWYFWVRAFVGNSHEGGMDPPPYIPGALSRYFAVGLLAYEMYKLA